MMSSHAHQYLSGLRFDPKAVRQCCMIPLGGIYWSDEIPDFDTLTQMQEDDRQCIYRLFSIRFRVWAKEKLSPEDDIFWCYCERTYPECPIVRRSILDPDDQKAQDECVAETIKGFDALFSGADKVEIEDGPHGTHDFSATFDLTKEDRPVSFWKRILRKWKP
jgi:hypothetical protein